MDDGSQQGLSENDVILLPPGHDARTAMTRSATLKPRSPLRSRPLRRED
jgi:hypothetical protein